jgi:hypothetical protein
MFMIAWGYKEPNVKTRWIFERTENSAFGNCW